MVEAKKMNTQGIELFTSKIQLVETQDVSDSLRPRRAVITMRLINEGANTKNLYWKPETMQKIAHMFQGVPFRYDLNGENEGSHTKDRLSSPFYDVGWTYSDEKGAWFDPKENCIWVKGEVTHPDVVEKLMRTTTDGKREINFGSMGAMMKPEDTECSICGKSPFGSCNHQRGEVYNGETCNMVPTNISKALHVALTNDPADRVAEIAEAVFQDMATNDGPMPVPVGPEAVMNNDPELLSMIKNFTLDIQKKKKSKEDATMKEDKDKKEEKKEDVEKKAEKGNESLEDKKEDKKEEKKVEMADDKEKKPFEEKEDKKEEKEDSPKEDAKEDKKEEKEDKKEDEKEDDEEEKKKKKVETADMSSDVEFKISGRTDRGVNKIEVAQPVKVVETASVDYAEKYKKKLIVEVADSYVRLKKAGSQADAVNQLAGKSIEQLEIYQDALSGIIMEDVPKVQPKVVLQDNSHAANFANDVPEYGGVVEQGVDVLEVQDMSPDERRAKFGEFGAFDVLFNPQNAHKYRR